MMMESHEALSRVIHEGIYRSIYSALFFLVHDYDCMTSSLIFQFKTDMFDKRNMWDKGERERGRKQMRRGGSKGRAFSPFPSKGGKERHRENHCQSRAQTFVNNFE